MFIAFFTVSTVGGVGGREIGNDSEESKMILFLFRLESILSVSHPTTEQKHRIKVLNSTTLLILIFQILVMFLIILVAFLIRLQILINIKTSPMPVYSVWNLKPTMMQAGSLQA